MMSEQNPFRKIEAPKAPDTLKERVMTSVELSQLFIEVTDLFTDKMGKTALNLFRPAPGTDDDPQTPS